MKHLIPLNSILETKRYPSSTWPKRKYYGGVDVIEILDPKKPNDRRKIEDYMKLAYEKNKWFSRFFDVAGNFKGVIPSDVIFTEISLPSGIIEIVYFEEETYEDEKLLVGETLDQRWEFSVPYSDRWSDDPLWQDLDFNKKYTPNQYNQF